MKSKLLLSIISISFFAQIVFAQKPYVATTSSVVLYLNGALVTDSCQVTFESGFNKLKVLHLSDDFEPEQASVIVPKGVKILHVGVIQNDLNAEDYLNDIKIAKDSLELFERESDRIKDQKQVFQTQLTLLEKNMHFKGDQSSLSIEELKKGMDYYKSIQTTIYKEIRELNQLELQNNKEIKRIRERVKDLLSASGYTRKGVEIAYHSSKTRKASLKIGYTIRRAGWAPFFNMRADDLNKPVTLEHMANAWNRSGKNWYQIQLTLSTANPYNHASVPQLQKWIIDFYKESHAIGYTNQYVIKNKNTRARSDSRPEEAMSVEADLEEFLPPTLIQERTLSVDYQVSGRYDLMSSGKAQSIYMKEDTVRGTYRYLSIPKKDRDAFLLCAIDNWSRLNLLQGQMNLYLEGNYVGNSMIQTRYAGDSLDLSFGKDPRIIVNRTKSSKFTKRQIIGSKATERLEFEIKVRNNNKKEVYIELLDQIPVSQRSEIEVNVLEISGATWNKESGKLIWKFKLSPSETKSFKIAFEVKYPKDKDVHID